MRGQCRECHQLTFLRSRGLCAKCFADPVVRERNPAAHGGRPRAASLTREGEQPKGVRVGVCAECGRPARLVGRNLCSACYSHPDVRTRHPVLPSAELSASRRGKKKVRAPQQPAGFVRFAPDAAIPPEPDADPVIAAMRTEIRCLRKALARKDWPLIQELSLKIRAGREQENEMQDYAI